MQHPKRFQIIKELKRRKKGFRGEQSLDYDLRFLPYHSYQILHDLRLFVFGKHFQIDTLVLTPKVGFIIEAKNLSGRIYYDHKKKKFMQMLQGVSEPIDDPLIQVTRHQKQLHEWLRYRSFNGYPIIPLVAITNPSTIIEAPENHEHNWPLFNSVHVVEKIQKIEEQFQTRRSMELDSIRDTLIYEHSPKDQDILDKFSIDVSEVMGGVLCPSCSKLQMNYVKRKWQCSFCKHRSKNAHLQAIADYLLLINDSITSKQFREFVNCSDPYLAARLLSKSGMPYSGETKGRVYYRPDDIKKLLGIDL